MPTAPLQVEHPVTEQVTRRDLVLEQIRQEDLFAYQNPPPDPTSLFSNDETGGERDAFDALVKEYPRLLGIGAHKWVRPELETPVPDGALYLWEPRFGPRFYRPLPDPELLQD